MLFTWNLSPLRPSKFSFEYLLLPPRSALEPVSPRLTPRDAPRAPRPPTHHGIALALMVEYNVTHSLADSDFHGHRPAV